MSNNGSRNEVQEVLFEFIITGNFVKVIAVDPRTNTEISIVGDRRLSKSVLQRNVRYRHNVGEEKVQGAAE